MKNKSYHMVMTLVFALMITLPLFFRGLYFEKDQLPALIGIYLVFAIWSIFKIKKKDYILLKDPTDYILLAIVIIYGLSVFYGVDKRTALFEFSRHMIYFIVFIMAKEISDKTIYKKAILDIVLVGGVLVSLIGIGTAVGTWDYNGAMLGTRLSSTFQYPNTMAAYVGSLYFLGLTMLINEEKKILKFFYGLSLGTFLFALLLTYSRGMWVIFPLIAVLYFLASPNKRKLESMIYMIGSALLSLPGAFLFARTLTEASSDMWKYYILAAGGTGALMLLLSLLESFYRKIQVKYVLVVIALLIAGSGFGLFHIINETEDLDYTNVGEEAQNQSLSRNISQTLPSSSYTLETEYVSKNDSEAPYAGRIRVFNIDKNKKTSQIAIENIVETSSGKLSLEFETPEDSIGTRVLLNNYYPDTSIVFSEIRLIDNYNDKEIYKVPLKYKYIPESIVTRVSSLGTGGTSSDARIIFMKDGLEIVKKSPILGSGGGGWESLYHQYQSYPYWSNQAHNYVLQLWIEIGSIGFLLFLGLMLVLTVFAFTTYKRSEEIENKLLIAGLYFTMISMLAHAIIDFDMSLPAYAIVFWAIVGVLASSLDYYAKNIKFLDRVKRFNSSIFSYIILGLVAFLLFNSIQIRRSINYANAGVEASEAGNVDGVIENFEKAVRLDSYKYDYYHDLMKMYMTKYENTGDTDYPRMAFESSQKFMELAKYDPVLYGSIASFYLSVGKLDEALDLLDRAVELQPMVTEQYISKGNGYLAVFRYYYQNEDYESARATLERALKIKEDLRETSKRTLQPLSTNIDLIYKIGEIQYYLDNFDAPDQAFALGYNLDFAYYFDIDANNDGKIDMLYESRPEGSNIDYENMSEGDIDFIRVTNSGEVYGFIYPYGIRLEPDTEYLVQLKSRGNIELETANIYAWSNGSEDPNQGSIIGLPLNEVWLPHMFEFTTDSDVEPGKQYIRIQHNGNDKGYIDIKELAIFKKDKK